MKNFSKNLVRETIDEVDGIISKDYSFYPQKSKVFFEDRYFSMLNRFPILKKDSIGLEVGLSGGILAILLQKIYKPKKMFALEHPVSIKSYTNKFLNHIKNSRIILHSSDLTKPNFFKNKNSLDFVSFCDVMEHLVPADLPKIFTEFNHILKEDGYLIVNTPNIASLLKRLNLLRGKNPIEFDVCLHEKATYGHIREYTLNEIRSILEQTGFKIENEIYFEIDAKRNIFTRIENILSKLIPSFANSILVVARKK
jgi:SAM-dependent methyltransferase